MTTPSSRAASPLLHALLGLALLGASAARADEISLGAGAGADRGNTRCVAADACDHTDAFGKLFAGYRFDSGVELQALAFDAGRFKGGDTTPLGTQFGGGFNVRGVAVTAGFRWAFAPRWSLLGQAGVASVRTRFDYAAPFAGAANKTTTQPLAGLGLAYDIAPKWRVSMDFDETRFKAYTRNGSLRLLGASIQYVF